VVIIFLIKTQIMFFSHEDNNIENKIRRKIKLTMPNIAIDIDTK